MPRPRVLVVDDSVLVRKVVSRIVADDPWLELAGVAANGRIALAKIALDPPDLVTLDVEMPELDGLETLKLIRRDHPGLRVVMLSAHTERGAVASLDALSLGANDYVTKPSGAGRAEDALERLRDTLIPKLRALCPPFSSAPTPPAGWPLATALVAPTGSSAAQAVAIAASTGGPHALLDIVPQLPPDFPLPVLIVQHMPPLFTAHLAQRLDARSALTVREATESGVPVQPGTVWVATGGRHLAVQGGRGRATLSIHDEPPENSVRPAADVLFRSMAEVYGAGSLALLLTGMGQDGLRGAERIRQAGGRVLAQDRKSSVVWGMPGAVVEAGLVEQVFPLKALAGALVAEGLRHEGARRERPES